MRPETCDGRLCYIGYAVTRGGLQLGPKARGRMRENLANAVWDSERVRASVTSFAVAWMLGK